LIVNRSINQFLALYALVLVVVLLCEWAGNRYFPFLLPGYFESRKFLYPDTAGRFLTLLGSLSAQGPHWAQSGHLCAV
jgi:hypothetical protein